MTVEKLCVDRYLPGEQFDPARLPPLDNLARATHKELALDWDTRWQTGQELRIRFLDGDRAGRARVEAVARTWLDHANLGFVFGDFLDSDIRITFTGSEYSSSVGKDATHVPPDEPTMILSGLDHEEDPIHLRSVVLHEFGHAIGCIHEQASPAANIPWDEAKVYAYYLQHEGWNKPTTYHNVLLRYAAGDSIPHTPHDPDSIMQYPVPSFLTLDGSEIGWNTDLSAGDKAFIAKMYPRQA